MQLTYALRPEPAHHEGTPASAYTRERRILEAYTAQLYAQEPEALMRAVWGKKLTDRQMYGGELLANGRIRRAHKPGRIDRLDEDVPDLIRQLRPDEQEPIEALLLAGDLVGCIKKLLGQYRGGARRDTDARLSEYKHDQTRADWEEDPRQYHNDGWRIKAAGLGRLTREAYGRPLGKPLELTPPAPVLRVSAGRRKQRAHRVRFHHEPAGQLSFWA